MNTTHADVLSSLASWNLQEIVECKEVKGRTELTYKGEVQSFPHWLALRRVNLIGANHTCDPENL
jgi:hypothetical protein